jgi:hypothetical protein
VNGRTNYDIDDLTPSAGATVLELFDIGRLLKLGDDHDCRSAPHARRMRVDPVEAGSAAGD